MAAFAIWHNPRCSKSRATLARLEAAGVDVTVRRYLDDPPSREELLRALEALDMQPHQLIRAKDALVRELGLRLDDDAGLLRAMVAYPKLIERPVVFHEGRAVLGRPPENVDQLLASGEQVP